MDFYSYPVIDGKKSMDIPYEIFNEDIKLCEDKVIGAFVGRRLPFNWVHNAINRAWKTKGNIQMTIHSESIFIFDFNCPEDRARALEMGSIFISNRLFIITPWSRPVEQEIAELKSLPVWMNFRNVPLFMWNKKGLSMIASFLGKPLMMDTQTLNKTRMNYARICVEVDVTCEFPDSFTFTLGGKDKVEYSWKPSKCNECAVFGNSSLNFPKHIKPSQKVVQKWVQKKATTNVDQEGWITKSKNGVQNNDSVTEVIEKVVSHTAMDIDQMDPVQEVTTVLQEISTRKDNNVNDFIASNPFFILDKCMGNSHELPAEHNKETFQALMNAAQQKSKEYEASSSGSISHFQRREGLLPPAINLVPKISYLKTSARDNDCVYSVGRIWVAWDPGVVQISLISSSPQAIFLEISFSSELNFVATFVYGDNYYVTRNSLWDFINAFASFNEFSRCVQYSQLLDLPYSGCFFTWSNCHQDGTIIRPKLDRVMTNMIEIFWEWAIKAGTSLLKLIFKNISEQVINAKERMDSAQLLLQSHPLDSDLARRERLYVNEYVKLANDEESAAKQQSRIKWLDLDDVADLIKHVSREEVIIALHSIGSNKDPGPDGFSSHFFKACWTTLGDELVAAIQNFFNKSKLLKEVNSTFITLIAKKKNPSFVTDYRPISCCNVIYKCITKIISLRMKKILGGLISQNQSTFISGRSIQDNIMVAHELVRNYHRSKGSPRCALKIDLTKAYDTVRWETIFYMLQQLGFPDMFINWIQRCITSAKFSIIINGSPYGFFGAKRGLRQGCPISPYLFVLAMEMLSATLLQQVKIQKFGFHPICKLTSLTHLCCADDVMIFFKGSIAVASSLKEALVEFSNYTGLEINNQKTSLFYSAVDDITLQQIVQILNCSVGELPRAIKELNSKFKRFLWCGAELKKRSNPIKWTFTCHPCEEGGLGIRDLENTNIAANLRHIWDLVSGKNTIWTTWVKCNLIKDKDFWAMNIPQNSCWFWRRILDHKDIAKKHIGVMLGNGEATSFLHENWHSRGIITDWVAPHILDTIRITEESKVVDFLSTTGW
ncbi:uncharacterized protein LOC113359390 [Papaver somniferum]|uniref:uncharacterized protein LOC113359390 n=1 Tax=Papaver somniferum TaxID=3469 RepID=UPI000E6FBD1D|nr:uncharacterized protein LOC113359390 [Papaver somniferum]